MFWNVTLPVLFFLLSCSDGGKANAKRGSRQDGGKLVATLCHYYSDGAMGCKECFEVARSHRSNHNSSLLPPCKSVQGIKRRNWTLDDGIIMNATIDTNSTKRLTIASCAFYANKTFTCVATRNSQCENWTQVECANNTSWSGRFEGSITDGFRCISGHSLQKTTPGFLSKSSSTKGVTLATTTARANNIHGVTRNRSTTNTIQLSTTTTTSTSSSVTQIVSDSANEVQKMPIVPSAAVTGRRTKLPLDHAATEPTTPTKSFTLTSRAVTSTDLSHSTTEAPSSTEFTENCTETSCTIFAETVQPNTTDPNQPANNETIKFDSDLDQTVIRSTSSGNGSKSLHLNTTTEATLLSSTGATSTSRKVEELGTSTNQFGGGSLSMLTSSPPTDATSFVTQPFSNKTFAPGKPEPRKGRHPIRRMY